jgi:hypothetical protein
MQVPEPEGVKQADFVQHLISDEPEHRLEVTAPEQQPAEMETHTPE